MKIFKILLWVILLLLVIGMLLPATTHVERAIVINAPQEQVFSFVNDYRKFNLWSPWYRRDPDTSYEYSGPDSGVGSKMSWASEHEGVGTGSQEIVESEPHRYVKTLLDFGEQGQAEASYTLKSADEGTEIIWALDMEHGWNLVSRLFGLMMDGLVGPDYEDGLRNLKEVVEGEARPQLEQPETVPEVSNEN